MKRTSPNVSDLRHHRRAMALLSALVCVVVLAALSLTLTRTVLARVREADLHHHQLQADALAESAIVRAQAQWQANPTWTGEDWTPDVARHLKLRAEIRLQPTASPTQLQIVSLVPADSPSPVRVERTLPWPPAPTSQVVTP